jgi:hypothetical protein
MAVRNATTSSGACPACGAYGNSQHRPTCQPGRRLKLGRMRRARRDSRTSWAARVHAQGQRALLRGLLPDEARTARRDLAEHAD